VLAQIHQARTYAHRILHYAQVRPATYAHTHTHTTFDKVFVLPLVITSHSHAHKAPLTNTPDQHIRRVPARLYACSLLVTVTPSQTPKQIHGMFVRPMADCTAPVCILQQAHLDLRHLGSFSASHLLRRTAISSLLLRLLAVQVKISLRRTSTTAVTTQCYVVVHAASKLVCCLARKPRPEAHVRLRACILIMNVHVCLHMMRRIGSGHAMPGCVWHTQMH
jgi:hypothetical protein